MFFFNKSYQLNLKFHINNANLKQCNYAFFIILIATTKIKETEFLIPYEAMKFSDIFSNYVMYFL